IAAEGVGGLVRLGQAQIRGGNRREANVTKQVGQFPDLALVVGGGDQAAGRELSAGAHGVLRPFVYPGGRAYCFSIWSESIPPDKLSSGKFASGAPSA